MQLPITYGLYIDDSMPLSIQQCINCYPNILQSQGGLSSETLKATPGSTQLATSGGTDNINRGSHIMLKVAYAVNGDCLYRLNRAFSGSTESFSYTDLGSISGNGRVSMADNGAQLMILVPGGAGYIYTAATGVLSEITDPDFSASGNPQYVIFIDGRFACSTDSKAWIVSDLNDGTSWNALLFGSAESDPDIIVTLAKTKNQVFVLGSETTEGFQNIGGADFPFQRSNIFLDKGCRAPFSVINVSNGFFMVGAGKNETPAIWHYKDGDYTKISHTGIDDTISGYTDTQVQNCFAFSYAQSGHYFVGFTFSQTTFVYDLTTSRWHERKSKSGDSQSRWRVNSLVSAYGRILVFDSTDGRCGELDISEYSEYDNDVTRQFTTMPFFETEKEIALKRIELTIESGVGNSVVPDPKMTLEISKDAKTWGNPRERKMGKIGKYNTQVVWKRNGRSSKFMVLRFKCSDQVKFSAIKLEAQ